MSINHNFSLSLLSVSLSFFQDGAQKGCCGGCTWTKVRTYLKMFFAQLFSHVGLCALVIGYTIMGAFIFVYLEKDNELATRAKVGNTRIDTLNELYNITGGKNTTAH